MSETINDFVLSSISGDLRAGGVIVTGTIYGDTDLLSEGDPVRLLAKSMADYSDTDYREFFSGHVLEDPDFTFSPFTSEARVNIGTANYLMTGRLQAIGFTEQVSPANDHQFSATARISDYFTHAIDSHCNFLYHSTHRPEGIIFDTSIDTADTPLARFNAEGGDNMWQAIMSQYAGGAEGGIQFFEVYFNRRNKLFYQPAAAFQASPPASKGTLTKEHLRGGVTAVVRDGKQANKTGQVQLTAFDSDQGELIGVYPSDPLEGRILIMTSNIYADTQARVNTLAENLYKWLNRPYTLTVQVDPGLILFGDDGTGLDLGDKITMDYDGPTEDAITGAGVHVNFNQDFWVYGYNVSYDAETKIAQGELLLEADN